MTGLYLKIALLGGILAALGLGAWYLHHTWWADGYAQAMDQVKAHTRVVVKEQRVVTTRIVKQLVPVLKVIHERGAVIIKRVPVYVTPADNARCRINVGFVRLWNDANRMSVPAAASSVDETSSAVVLSDVASQHAREASICHSNDAYYRALQAWVRQQDAIH